MEIVDPARNTGSSTANGVTAPVRPTFTSILCSFVVFCSAGNLKAIAERGNLLVAPRRRRWAYESTLMTTPSVSKASDRRRSAHSAQNRSEEHTSELQSRLHLVCRLLLEKKKKKQTIQHIILDLI